MQTERGSPGGTLNRLPVRSRLARLAWIAPAVFVADLATKRLLFWPSPAPYEPPPSLAVIPGFFSIQAAQNTGGVFGLLQGTPYSNLVFIAVAIVAAVFLTRLAATSADTAPMIWGVGLVMGGALGNLWDRLWFGFVRDFLLFYVGKYHWPNFNVADSAICVGTAILGWAYWKKDGE